MNSRSAGVKVAADMARRYVTHRDVSMERVRPGCLNRACRAANSRSRRERPTPEPRARRRARCACPCATGPSARRYVVCGGAGRSSRITHQEESMRQSTFDPEKTVEVTAFAASGLAATRMLAEAALERAVKQDVTG